MSPFMRKKRFCRSFEGATYFKPRGVPLKGLQINELELDELEAIHLCDYEELNQAEAAEKMKISSSTLQRLLYSGRKKIIDALYTSKAIKISKSDQVSEYSKSGKECRKKQRKGKCFGNRKLEEKK
ncbi:MAG: DUF134 domain-containing protein [Gammaproteobacteria bacterium]